MESRIFASATPAALAPAGEFSTIPGAWHLDARRNIVAGMLAALLSLPLSIGMGAVAFAALGPQYITYGVLAGLYGAAFMGLVAVLAGSRGPAIYAPRSLVSFMVAAVCTHTLVGAAWLPADDPEVVVSAVLFILALAGLMQFGFGLLHLARLVKLIPTPVMAGFQNAASIMLVLSQLHVVLGLASRPAWAGWPAAVMDMRPLSLVVAAATYLLATYGARLLKRVPPLVTALIGGTGLYYLLAAAGGSGLLGPTLGPIPMVMPDGHHFAGVISLAVRPGFLQALPSLVLGAASIAIVASLDVLLCAKVIENLSGQRDNATRQLLCVGAANAVTPLLGGLGGSISMSPTVASIKAGGRNSLALFVHASLFLVLVPILAPLLAHLPQVVIGTLIAHAGVQLFDRWTLHLGKSVLAGRAVNWGSILIDLFVICLVTGIAIAGQVVLAVLIGIAIAVVVFTLRMSRGVIRSMRSGSEIQSRRNRHAADAELLGKHGQHILAIELEGPLFFASAETLHNCIDHAIAQGVRYVILDVARVNELDSTGARIVVQCCQRAKGAGVQLLMCGHEQRAETSSLLRDHSVAEALTEGRLFPDLDRALEWCENDLLRTLKTGGATEEDRAFELLDLAHGLAPDERATLKEALSRHEYAPGETVFAQSDSSDALFVILRGSASVRLVDPRGRERRLVTFSAGTVFGEMALIDSQPRSATVVADEPLTCYALERAAFDQLSVSHPRIGMTLLANLARELSHRIRRANLALSEQT